MRRALDAAAIAQAESMIVTVDALHPGSVTDLKQDALTTIGTWDEVAVRMMPGEADTAAATGSCSVAGYYASDATPPTLNVAASASVRRRQFTVLHELGHHLQQTNVALGSAVFAHGDSMSFEDAACDAFASRILLPTELVDAHIGDRGPTADAVAALFASSSASRAACCVRAAERLSSGAVVLLDDTGTVNFAAARGVYPPARGTSQRGTPLIDAMLAADDPGRLITRETRIAYRTGGTSDVMYGQAAWCDGYVVAVLATDSVPWQAFAVPKSGTATYATEWDDCEVCGTNFQVTARCKTCKGPLCPNRHCDCSTARNRTCMNCFLVLAPTRFDPGKDICRDCLS